MAFDRAAIQTTAAQLAKKGVYIGTSSWKYDGWFDQLYTPARYEYRGKVAKTRFERECLNECAEVFKTVCVDAAYYTFPCREYLEGMAAQVPDDFRLGRMEECQTWFKTAMALDERTVKREAIDDPDLKPLWDSVSGTMWKRTE
jgi:hypothetical protein